MQLCGDWAGELSGRLLEGPIHLPAPNKKCLVLNGLVHGLWTFRFYLNPGEAQTALGECFVCVNMCMITWDTVDLGMKLGWESSVLSILFLPQQEEAEKGRERKSISKAERGRRTCYIYRHGQGISTSSSSTQVTLQPLEWELDSKLVT